MIATKIANVLRVKILRGWGAALSVVVLCATQALAQYGGPPPAAVPGAPAGPPGGRNPTCLRLEGQLAMVDRGGAVDPAKADQIRRYEGEAGKLQAELDRLGQQSQRLGCRGGGFFSLFSGQPQQCTPLGNQMQQVRDNLDRYLAEIQRLQGNSGEREGQRRSILVALGQNDCGPQYRQYANSGSGGFFDNLFGTISSAVPGAPNAPPAGTYRTLCVRTCDGYYFPISYSTVPGKFAEDEATCQRLCPATEAVLFSHRNPGEDVARAVSASGKVYSDLPTAFSYRKQYNPACSCRAPGQSWADALRQGDDQTVERGDIVVTEERAKQLSQPRFDSQGKPVNLDPNASRQGAAPALGTPAPGAPALRGANAAVNATPLPPPGTKPPPAPKAAAPAPPADEQTEEDPSKRKVRSVGPAFLPGR
jgi:Protein of unknown function (DUF2865)